MSGAPKRPHEDSSTHSSSKYGHDDIGPYPRTFTAVSSEYHHPSHDASLDSRMVKIPRMENRDPDRRSPLHSIYRMPLSSVDDQHVDHHPSSDNRPERDSRDNRDFRVDNRDPKAEMMRESYEPKRDVHVQKSEKDGKFEIRGDENKKFKYDGEGFNDHKSDIKVEKDSHGTGSSHLSWKEQKEYHRGKRQSETPVGSMDTWHVSRNSSQGPFESGREDLATEERGYGDAHEAVGENKVDVKAEDRLKEKDKKRKDAKHRDWGDRDKERAERRSTMLVSNSSSECKESVREERDAERWDRERKDPMKDKERLKEREKDTLKRETLIGPLEKDGVHGEKDSGEVSVKMSEQENLASELKKKEDGWKNVDKEARDRKKERELNAEGDRAEKRNRGYDKEPDDGCVDGEGMEKEREVFNYDGVQQRKRMLRPRGSPQTIGRESRFRSRTQDPEGSQGKSEVSYVIYKVGESMQELIKLWKEYESSQLEKNGEGNQNGPTLEIRIPAEHVTATNRQVRGGQLWGTDTYTYDSDLVAVLMHTGYCRPTASPPPSAIQELRATIRVLPPLDCYISSLRNNVRSRAWGAAIGCSYRVERCCIVKKGGGTIDLEPCITHTSTVEPTLAPVAVERTMTTRAAASNALRQQRFVREVTIQYNLCNEPWIKYSLSIVADKGLKKPLYTSARLKKGEVLYLETHSCRYELCFAGEKMVKTLVATQAHEAEADKSQNHHMHAVNGERTDNENAVINVFRWSRCKKPLPQKVMRSVGIPLPLEYLEVLEENLDWEDVQWSQTGVWIAGKEYTLARVHFLSMN